MNITEAIRARRSIRKYAAGAEIPDADIQTLLEAAMMAPSACNMRPWEFVVVKDAACKQALVGAHPFAKHLLEASIGIVVCGLPEKHNQLSAEFWPQDCGAAVENILLQALGLGYGTCWCGIYPNPDRVRQFQQILDVQSVPLALITVGVPAETPDARGFYDPKAVIYR